MKKKHEEGLVDQLEKPINITFGKGSIKMPAVILIILVLLLGAGAAFWVTDINVLGCHKPPQPLPGMRR
jgi:hypothetical protein